MKTTESNARKEKPATLLVPRFDRDGHFQAMDLYEIDRTSGQSKVGAVEYVEVRSIDQEGGNSVRKISLLEYVQGMVNGHMKTFHDGNLIKWAGHSHPGTFIAGRCSWSIHKETLTVYILDSSVIVRATRVASLPYDLTNPVLCRMFESLLTTRTDGWNAFGERDRKQAEYHNRLASCSDAIRPVVAAGV